ncbi:MAG: hypothetical protein MHPSP_004866, partial [Paramarteilia canceri]
MTAKKNDSSTIGYSFVQLKPDLGPLPNGTRFLNIYQNLESMNVNGSFEHQTTTSESKKDNQILDQKKNRLICEFELNSLVHSD